jgi:tetratricopeptide (TPR) repeat protein
VGRRFLVVLAIAGLTAKGVAANEIELLESIERRTNYFYTAPTQSEFEAIQGVIRRNLASIDRKVNYRPESIAGPYSGSEHQTVLIAVFLARVHERHGWAIGDMGGLDDLAMSIAGHDGSDLSNYVNDDSLLDGSKLDIWWMGFSATGDTRYLDQLARQVMPLTSEMKPSQAMISAAANWSFESNCRQHPAILSYAKSLLAQEPPVPNKGHLSQIVARAKGGSDAAEDCHKEFGDVAIAACNEAIRQDPRSASAYTSRGNQYLVKGEYDPAIGDWTKAIEIDPKLAIAYFNRGNGYYLKSEYDRAIEDFTKAIETGLPARSAATRIRPGEIQDTVLPTAAIAYSNRGDAYSRKGDDAHAIADYSKAIEIDPNFEEAYLNRGSVYASKGEYDRAIVDYSKAIDINPKFEAHANRGSAYLAKRDYDRAITDLTRAIDINPKYQNAYLRRAEAYAYKREYDHAVSDYSKVIDINPTEANLYIYRAGFYLMARKPEQAFSDAERSLELRPDSAAGFYTRGLAYEALGRREEAIADFRRALVKDPNMRASKDALRQLGASH